MPNIDTRMTQVQSEYLSERMKKWYEIKFLDKLAKNPTHLSLKARFVQPNVKVGNIDEFVRPNAKVANLNNSIWAKIVSSLGKIFK